MTKHLTVGELKKCLEGLSDDLPVYYQRIEDEPYFKDGDWSTIDKHLIFNCWCGGKTVLSPEQVKERHELFCKSHYIPAESAYKHPDDEVFVINAHY